MKTIKTDYNFYLGPGKPRPGKLRLKDLKAMGVTCRHLVQDGSGEKEDSDPFVRNTYFQNN